MKRTREYGVESIVFKNVGEWPPLYGQSVEGSFGIRNIANRPCVRPRVRRNDVA